MKRIPVRSVLDQLISEALRRGRRGAGEIRLEPLEIEIDSRDRSRVQPEQLELPLSSDPRVQISDADLL